MGAVAMTTDTKRQKVIRSLRDKESRDAYVSAHIETGVQFQVRANRYRREWTQSELATRAGWKSQAAISLAENSDDRSPSIPTLKKIAAAFDVALIVRFVPFSELVDYNQSLGGRDLGIPSFDDDAGLRDKERLP